MFEIKQNVLAELYLFNKEFLNKICRLCGRVFTWFLDGINKDKADETIENWGIEESQTNISIKLEKEIQIFVPIDADTSKPPAKFKKEYKNKKIKTRFTSSKNLGILSHKLNMDNNISEEGSDSYTTDDEVVSFNCTTETNGESEQEINEAENSLVLHELYQMRLMGLPLEFKARDTSQNLNTLNQKSGKKKKRSRGLPSAIKGNPKLKKYWRKRYSLFSKFDLGIKLDEESWFSVTPELIAQNTAQRCQCNLIVDAFCGVGGNAIQFALTCNKVIAIDIDPQKIDFAKHNAEVYGVANRIEFIVGDFFQLVDSLKADVVFLSPPWGGPKYLSQPVYELEQLQPLPFMDLLKATRSITSNIALFLPRNSNIDQLEIAAGPGGQVEIEKNYLSDRLVAITVYYGNLIQDSKDAYVDIATYDTVD